MKLKKNLIYLNKLISTKNKLLNCSFKNLELGNYIAIKLLSPDTTKKNQKLNKLNTITGFLLFKHYNIKTKSIKIKISVLYKTERIIFTCILNSPYIVGVNILNKQKKNS